MKTKLYLAAALLMASTAAHAGGISFEIDGQKIHIEAPRNCNSLSCLSVTNNGSSINLRNMNLRGHNSNDDDDGDDVASTAPAPAPRPATPPPAPAAQAPTPAPAPVANNAPPAPPAADPAPSRERVTALPPAPPAATSQPPRAAAAPANPAPVANNAPPAAPPAPPAAPPAQAANTPLGLWQTEDNKGNVRIEQCGANLCGYAEKTNERILINMKPAETNKWSGRIHDPDSGSNYDSTIALKGPNMLKVQGCAFGGLFCGGQTWKRIS